MPKPRLVRLLSESDSIIKISSREIPCWMNVVLRGGEVDFEKCLENATVVHTCAVVVLRFVQVLIVFENKCV